MKRNTWWSKNHVLSYKGKIICNKSDWKPEALQTDKGSSRYAEHACEDTSLQTVRGESRHVNSISLRLPIGADDLTLQQNQNQDEGGRGNREGDGRGGRSREQAPNSWSQAFNFEGEPPAIVFILLQFLSCFFLSSLKVIFYLLLQYFLSACRLLFQL